MTLDPAWFNNLIDDTGTGTTGTVWNKATINGLLTNINTALGNKWLDLTGETYSGSGTVTLLAGGVRTYAFDVSQRRTFFDFYISVSVAGTAGASLNINLPGATLPGAARTATGVFHYFGGGIVGTGVSIVNGLQIQLMRDLGGTVWPSPLATLYLAIQGSYVY